MKKIANISILMCTFIAQNILGSQSGNYGHMQMGLAFASFGCAAIAVKSLVNYSGGTLPSFGSSTTINSDSRGQLRIVHNGKSVQPNYNADGTCSYHSSQNSLLTSSSVSVQSGKNNSFSNNRGSLSEESRFLNDINEQPSGLMRKKCLWSAAGWTSLAAAFGAILYWTANKKS